MKILRIDKQGALEDRVYNSQEELRLQLCEYHSVDWEGVDDDNNDSDIFELTLDEICDYGEWDYQIITNKKAKEYENEDYVYER